MRKALTALLAAATIAAGVAAAANEANAGSKSGAVAAGVIGGLAAGAIIGSAMSRPAYAYPAYAPPPGYVVYESYRAPYPVGCPGGHWARRPVAFDYYGRPVAWSKPRFVCPGYY